MADKIRDYSTSKVITKDIAQSVDDMVNVAKNGRKSFERRWYDNNLFDDGFHFRYLSRQTNKIVDLSERATIYTPSRAIPKASRQIRGVANILVGQDFVPVVYPENVSQVNFPPTETMDPETGQMVRQPNPEYEKAREEAKTIAKKSGLWLREEWKYQELVEKIALMIILATKHGISYLQVWPDAIKEAIKTQVYDAFDIYLMGNMTQIYDSPFLIKAVPKLVSQIKANENFNKEQVEKINPDNKLASSEIKEAYMTGRFGSETATDQSATLLLKEAFMKEYLNSNNVARVRKQDNGEQILKDKDEGDVLIRHIFTAGGVWLRDEYLNLPDYPFVDFRMEPGPIYQVPLIERFIPANKSLDAVVSRVERYAHTMVTGTWMKRKGEDFKINNIAGGQVIEYDVTPPTQGLIAPLPSFLFNFIQMLNGQMEEQGVTTTTLGKIPPGVKANAAIESLKESELANLVIANRMLRQTVRRIAEKMLDLADDYFVSPQTVYYLEKGEPQYFDIIGNTALQKRKELNIETDRAVVPIKKDYRVDIEVSSNMGYTKEGQRTTMLSIAQFMRDLAREGYLSQQAVKVVLERLLETYEFGATSEFMEAMENFEGQGALTDEQIMKMKTAFLEVIKDIKDAGGGLPIDTQQGVDQTKVGVAEVLKDLQGGGQPLGGEEAR